MQHYWEVREKGLSKSESLGDIGSCPYGTGMEGSLGVGISVPVEAILIQPTDKRIFSARFYLTYSDISILFQMAANYSYK